MTAASDDRAASNRLSKILGTTWSMLDHNSGKHPPEHKPSLSVSGRLRRFRQTHRGGQIEPRPKSGSNAQGPTRSSIPLSGATCRSSTPGASGERRLECWNAALDRHPLPRRMSRASVMAASTSSSALRSARHHRSSKNSEPKKSWGCGARPQPTVGTCPPSWPRGGGPNGVGVAFPNPAEAHGRLQTTRRRPHGLGSVPDPRSSGPNPPTRFGRHRWGLASARPRPDPTTLGTSDWSGAVPKSFRAGPDHPLPLGRPSGWPTWNCRVQPRRFFLVFGPPERASAGNLKASNETTSTPHRRTDCRHRTSDPKDDSATPARDGVRRGDVERLGDHGVPKFRKQLCLREL